MADVNDEYFMSLALSQARHAWDLGEIPVGAVIVNAAKEIVSVGCNRTIIDNDPCAHAEIVALRNAGKILDTYRLTDLTMYVTLCQVKTSCIWSKRSENGRMRICF